MSQPTDAFNALLVEAAGAMTRTMDWDEAYARVLPFLQRAFDLGKATAPDKPDGESSCTTDSTPFANSNNVVAGEPDGGAPT